ncbi:M1 family metallopeptidase [Isosphaeraceae bacterium EP7]
MKTSMSNHLKRSRRAVASLVLAGAAFMNACTPGLAADSKRDPHSYGNPDQIRVTNVDLDLEVDFERKAILGSAVLTVAREAGCPVDAKLVLDTRALEIASVEWAPTVGGPFKGVKFELGKADPILGAPLAIDVPSDAGAVRVTYKTTPGATALQWLDPVQTAGGENPFLFTQSQAIHARSWIPVQDSPGVRLTYTASIRVPKGLTAVMSADHLPAGDVPEVFRFAMPQPIPAYLIALGVGDLAFRQLGPRTGVYAEPSLVDRAAFEFADTETMVKVAEDRYGPYRWGRYDLLVLPPSFPYGGMENPKLTFATPTILAGDRSLVSLVAHELAHSWSGNLVTNATWRDFWLNEGFTTYIEGRIIEDVFGADRARMDDVLGLAKLKAEVKELKPADQILHIDLAGRDPDEGVTGIPYEKGALFLKTLEETFGREKFDAFIKGYFDKFAFRSLTTAEFRDHLEKTLLASDPKLAESIDVDGWIEKPGLDEKYTVPTSPRLAAVDRAVKGYVDGSMPLARIETADWSTQEWLGFLRGLPRDLSPEKMADLDAAFKLTDRGNSEIAAEWLQMAIRAKYKPADAKLEAFLAVVGRRKYLMPLYSELKKTPEGLARARAIYAKARRGYHPIAVESVDKLIGRPES